MYSSMTKLKIFLYHLGVFVVGSIGIAAYVLVRLSSPTSTAGLGGVIAMPAIILVYIIAFGILCLLSLAVWFVASLIRGRRK